MPPPEEPLLPVEPARSSRPGIRLLLAVAGAALIATAVAVLLLFRGGKPSGEAAVPAPAERPAAKNSGSAPGRTAAGEPHDGGAEERQARELHGAADAFERAEPAEYEKRMARWREVVTKFPTTGWGRKADERHRAAAAALQAFLDREFESTRRDAQSLSAAGHFSDAIETIQNYRSTQSRDLLKRRADAEIAGIENASRLTFNEAAAKAKDLAARGDYPAAVAIFDQLTGGAIVEVASRCRTAISQLQAAAGAHARHLESRKGDAARRRFREEVAPRILGFVRSRQYEEALQELSAAAGRPDNAALKDEIAAERGLVADASSFWEAFLSALRAKTGREVTLLLADGKRASGKISRVQPDRIVLALGDGDADIPLEKLHADLLVGWTLGKTLPAEDALSYVKAALFFFCEGRDDLAKLYLATARELNRPADASEKVFREGFLRGAMPLRK